eukprot:2695569-Pleurochrysis_carterae.AAC.1
MRGVDRTQGEPSRTRDAKRLGFIARALHRAHLRASPAETDARHRDDAARTLPACLLGVSRCARPKEGAGNMPRQVALSVPSAWGRTAEARSASCRAPVKAARSSRSSESTQLLCSRRTCLNNIQQASRLV